MLRLGVLAAASTTLGESTYELRLAFLLLRSPFGLVPFVPFICDDPFGDPPPPLAASVSPKTSQMAGRTMSSSVKEPLDAPLVSRRGVALLA